MATNPVFFHSSNNGSGEMMHTLNGAGIPFGVKSIDNAGFAVEVAKMVREGGVQHSVLLRFTSPGDLPHDIPNYRLPPEQAAASYWGELRKSIDGAPELTPYRDLIWIETINEARTQPDNDDPNWGGMHPVDWLGSFGYHLTQHILDAGFRACLFGMNAGTPEPEDWSRPGMKRFLELAADNPHEVAISLHEGKIIGYGDNPNLTIDSPIDAYSPFLIGRFQWLLNACNSMGIGWPTIFITEWAWAHNNIPGKSIVERDIDALARLVSQWGCVKNVFLWNLHQGWDGIGEKLKNHIPFVTDYTMSVDLPEPTQHPPVITDPTECRGKPRVQYSRTYVLIPPGMSDEMVAAAAAATSDPRWKATLGYSADDAGIGDLDTRKVAGVNPASWPAYPGGMAAWFNDNYPGVFYTEVVGTSPDDLKTKLLQYAGIIPVPPDPTPIFTLSIPLLLSQRNPLWANVIMGTLSGQVKTIGNWGCLVTAYCMQAAQFGLPHRNPDVMWQMFKNAGATNGPLLRDGALATAFPNDIKYLGYQHAGPTLYNRIRTHLQGGHMVIARVDFRPDTPEREEHWVGIHGYKVGYDEFLMCDPWFGDIEWVNARYGIPGSDIITALFYEKKTDEPTEPIPVSNPGIGLHANSSSQWQSADLVEFANLKPDWIKVMTNHSNQDISTLLAQHPLAKVVIRVFQEFGGRPVTPQEFYAWNYADVERVLALCSGRTVVIELHNEPNLRHEGCFVAWANGAGFNTWYKATLALYRQRFPSAKFIFPGLSPGPDYSDTNGVQQRINDTTFITACGPAITSSDGLGVHAYWGVTTLAAAVDVVKRYQSLANGKPVYITESSHNTPGTPEYKASGYIEFLKKLRYVPNIQAVIYFVVNSSHGQYQNETWVGKNLGALVRSSM